MWDVKFERLPIVRDGVFDGCSGSDTTEVCQRPFKHRLIDFEDSDEMIRVDQTKLESGQAR